MGQVVRTPLLEAWEGERLPPKDDLLDLDTRPPARLTPHKLVPFITPLGPSYTYPSGLTVDLRVIRRYYLGSDRLSGIGPTSYSKFSP